MDAVERAVKDIKTMKAQGARTSALVGLRALKEVVKENGFGRDFESACNALESSRPTAVALHNAIEKIKKEKTLDIINRMIYYFENVAQLIASKGSNLIKNNFTVLTHCHSSVAIEIMKAAYKKKKKFRVIVTETRPLYQGERTARELSDAGLHVVYIDDSAPGFFIKDVDMVLMGTDAIRKEGIVNKIGSYMISVLAKENKVPVYFAGELMKLDRRKKIIIEERNPEEIIDPRKLPGVKVENPAFDTTPWKYVTDIITERGILKPKKVLGLLKKS